MTQASLDGMGPLLAVPAGLTEVLQELQKLEPLFHGWASGATPQWFEELVAPDFWEVGASGRRIGRAHALGVLQARTREPRADECQMSGWHLFEAAPGLFVLTYALQQPGRTTLRMTLWRREGTRWQARYHQGTVVT